MAKWFPVWFNHQFFLKSGKPASNGWVEVKLHGLSTHAQTYNYNDQENENPISLDNYGRCQLKISDTINYDFYIYDEDMGLDNFIEGVRVPTYEGSTGTNDHTELINREALNQHIIASTTGLQDELDDKVSKSTTNYQIIKSVLMLDPSESDSCNVFINGGNQSTNTSAYFAVNSNTGNIRVVAPTNEIPYIGLGINSVVNSEKIEIKNSNGDYIRITATDIIKNGVSLISGESI